MRTESVHSPTDHTMSLACQMSCTEQANRKNLFLIWRFFQLLSLNCLIMVIAKQRCEVDLTNISQTLMLT